MKKSYYLFCLFFFASSLCIGQTICPEVTTVFKDWPAPGEGTAISNVQFFIESIEPGQTSGPITPAPMSAGCIDLGAAPVVGDGGSYRIYPEKDIDHRNGVSTLDLVYIARHLIGVSPFNPFQVLVADVDDSQSINVLDITAIQRLILSIDNELPTTSWKFIDRAGDVTSNPGVVFKNFVEIDPKNPPAEVSFWGVKMGDVNATSFPFAGGNDDLVLKIADQTLMAGETVTVDFLANDFKDFIAYQFSLVFDQQVLEYQEHEIKGLSTNDVMVWNTEELSAGIIPNLWVNFDGDLNLEEDSPIFTITFKVLQNSSLKEVLSANSNLTENLAYKTDSDEASKVVLDFGLLSNIENQNLSTTRLLQNQPNPVDQFTIIPFHLDQAGKINLSITDALGRIIKSIELQGIAGTQQIELQRTDFGAPGIYQYTLQTESLQISKRLIVK